MKLNQGSIKHYIDVVCWTHFLVELKGKIKSTKI
jgi:hypothetical protein